MNSPEAMQYVSATFTKVPDFQLEAKPGQLTSQQLQKFYDEVSG